jgi:PIN domain nuclease of toxin-antitoxin system
VSLLLDTHVFLWWLADDRRLGGKMRAAIQDPASRVLVSAVSVWEIAIKVSIGKLAWPATHSTSLGTCIQDSGLTELPVSARHAAAVRGLPFYHADPFDRLLVAQATEEALTIATVDTVFAAYGVATFVADA